MSMRDKFNALFSKRKEPDPATVKQVLSAEDQTIAEAEQRRQFAELEQRRTEATTAERARLHRENLTPELTREGTRPASTPSADKVETMVETINARFDTEQAVIAGKSGDQLLADGKSRENRAREDGGGKSGAAQDQTRQDDPLGPEQVTAGYIAEVTAYQAQEEALQAWTPEEREARIAAERDAREAREAAEHTAGHEIDPGHAIDP